jgi:hypothetical protein
MCTWPLRAQEPAAFERFQIAVAKYVSLHHKLERYLPPVINFTDPDEAERSMKSMAAALRRARSLAGEGEIFGGEIAMTFREVLRTRGLEDDECQRALADWPLEPQAGVSVTVNDAFPWAASRSLPSCLREGLPELPVELQYRLVGTHLMLVDLHAGLIVDVLRKAVPETSTR